MSSEQKKMLIAEIYSWLMNKYPYFTEANERSWRNRLVVLLKGSLTSKSDLASNVA